MDAVDQGVSETVAAGEVALNGPTRIEDRSMPSDDTAGISAWLLKESLRGTTQPDLLQGFCEKLVAAGIPLHRAHVGQCARHPVYGAAGFDWHRKSGRATPGNLAHANEQPEKSFDSPFHHMRENGLSELRQSLLDGDRTFQFPILEELHSHGATDYFASAAFFEQNPIGKPIDTGEPLEGMVSYWTSDTPGGFSDSDISAIKALLPVLGLALKSAPNYRAAHDLLAVYLGRDAGERVLSGDIQRGSLDTICAVIWYFDLQGFTKLAESTPGDQMIGMLNDYFGVVVEAVEAFGGDVLKFMGDGLLAIFKFIDDGGACCSRAIAAADELVGALAVINERRQAEGLVCTDFSLALHIGELLYGNIGAEGRLDFTVIGPAVNMAARIQAMCRPLEQNLIMSSAMAEAAVRERKRIVSIGRHVLRGIPESQELFTLRAAVYTDK